MAAFSKPNGLVAILFTLFVFLQATAALQHGHKHAVHRSSESLKTYEEEKDVLSKRANNVAIKGILGPTRYARLEIRDLQKNADQWNLFLLGMERFMAKPHNDRMSFYQVSGVHGRPFQTWNNFGPLVNHAGFCPHGSTLFGSWHRPYMALFEQAWMDNVKEVIATFPANQRSKWQTAASTLRFPFWDWARDPAGGPAVPASIRDQQVTVTKPSGRVTIANPLYSWSFGSTLPSEMEGGPFNNFATTLRRPVSNPTRSNNNEMNSRFANIRTSLRDRVFALFASKQSWGAASTSQIGVRTSRSGNSVDSFESVHDVIHVTAGGETGGHMYYLDYSSFDPIFWLHHMNVDRLLAMYQLIVPNTWVANGNIPRPMAQWNQGEPKNSGTPLKPFTKDTAGTYFTSNDIRDTRNFGYFYPDTSQNSYAQVARSVTQLYGAGSTLSKRDLSTGKYLGRPFKEGDYQTVLSIVANKYVMDGSYSVHCFLGGKPSSNSTSNSTAPYPSNSTSPYSNSTGSTNSTGDFTDDASYVGSYGVLGGSHAADNSSGYPLITEGCVPLTTALQGKEDAGELKSLHPDDVESYLKENLHYKIIGPGGKEIHGDSVPDFHVYVKSCPVTPSSSEDELPGFGEYVELPEATIDLPAGKPFTYTPSPIDIPYPGSEETYPGSPSSPSSYPTYATGTAPGVSYPTGVTPNPPSMPWQEPGYCGMETTIEYVDAAGNYLYSEKK